MSHKEHDRAATSRRTILKVGALASVGAISGGVGMTSAQSETEVTIEIDVRPEAEYITLRNYGENEVDLTGYSLNFDAEGGNDQIRQLSGDVVLTPGVERSVATGEQTTIETDYSLVDPYDGDVLANDGSDVVALLDPDGNEVSRSGGGRAPSDDTKTGIVRVVDQNGDPVQGETVRFTNALYDGEDDVRTTDENGETRIVLGSSDPSDVVAFDVQVRDQTKTIHLESDEEFGVTEIVFEVDNSEDDETHTATIVVTDIDGVRLEGVDVRVATYEAGEPVAEGTTDECGEVQFEVENGGYEVDADTDELSQSSANMGIGVDGEDATLVINLFDPDEYEGETPETGRNITEPEPCDDAEVDPGDVSDDTDDTDDGGQGDQADEGDGDQDDDTDETDDVDGQDQDEDAPSPDELAERTSESSEDDDCPKN